MSNEANKLAKFDQCSLQVTCKQMLNAQICCKGQMLEKNDVKNDEFDLFWAGLLCFHVGKFFLPTHEFWAMFGQVMTKIS